jgi:glutamine---fructose-6-phosphate transaminase (isomerizing)
VEGITCRVIVLEDDDVAHLHHGSYSIFNLRNECHETQVPRALLTLEMEVNSIMKGGYDHFMQKEIHEQPESLFQTMQGRVRFRTDIQVVHVLTPVCPLCQ